MRRIVFIAAIALAVCAGSARADGDPASDTLVLNNVFIPYETPAKSASTALSQQVAAAYARGYRVKVAVIATNVDLGAIPSLFNKPATYAKFLGQELSGYYIGPLLIVMPAGYGIYDGGRSTQAEDSVLAGLAKPASAKPTDLVTAATAAVGKLLGAGALRSTDIVKPFTDTLAGSVKRRTLSVRYYLFDDSERASVTVTIVHAGRTLYTTHIPLHTTGGDKPELRKLPLPSMLLPVGSRVCLVGVDAAGNRSPASCKRLSL